MLTIMPQGYKKHHSKELAMMAPHGVGLGQTLGRRAAQDTRGADHHRRLTGQIESRHGVPGV
jgi:hypothetical protein